MLTAASAVSGTKVFGGIEVSNCVSERRIDRAKDGRSASGSQLIRFCFSYSCSDDSVYLHKFVLVSGDSKEIETNVRG